MRVAARGLPLVCVNPAVCFGAGDHLLSSTRLVRSFLLGRVSVYTDGAPQHRGRSRRGRADICSPRPRRGRRALPARRAQLHLRPPLRRPRAPVGHRAAGEALGRHRRAGRHCCSRHAGRAWPLTPARGARRLRTLDLPVDQGAPRARLAPPAPRGDARGHGGLAPRARARPHRSHPPLAAGPVPAAGRCGDRRRRGSAVGLVCRRRWPAGRCQFDDPRPRQRPGRGLTGQPPSSTGEVHDLSPDWLESLETAQAGPGAARRPVSNGSSGLALRADGLGALAVALARAEGALQAPGARVRRARAPSKRRPPAASSRLDRSR